MAQQLILVKLLAAAARVDALLLDQQFLKVETSCLEEQVRGAEGNFKVMDAQVQSWHCDRAVLWRQRLDFACSRDVSHGSKATF